MSIDTAHQDLLLRIARGTLTAADAQLTRARTDRHTPFSRVAFLQLQRDRAERTLRDMLERIGQ